MKLPEVTLNHIIETVKERDVDADLDLIILAYEYASRAHKGQTRLSGEPYLQHSLVTALRLASMGLDTATIAAGILHDVPEDTDHTIDDIRTEFGEEIASLVDGITKLGKIKYRGLERYSENLRRMFVAMAKDVRVIFIKFADRIHNLTTLDALPPVKQQRIARETLDIYAPIANRLGMWQLRGELEDLAFPYVLPKEYEWITDLVKERVETQVKYLAHIKAEIEKEMATAGIKTIQVIGRTKHLYSLYRKLLRKDRDISKVYDLLAIRIILPEVKDCYHVLGLLHARWRPMPGRVKDYIAQPKPNGYQSLHTTIFTDEHKIVEFQIRTAAMHDKAEYGIAAHWMYKEDGGTQQKFDLPKTQLKWIHELLDMQKNVTDTQTYLDLLKIDIFQNHIFVLTPKGDVIDLPDNATPVDLAYHIHTELGDHCGGARANDKIIPLNTKLKSGDMVEIIEDKNKTGPSEDWLKFVQTHLARQKIKSFIKQKRANRLMQIFTRR